MRARGTRRKLLPLVGRGIIIAVMAARIGLKPAGPAAHQAILHR